MKNTHFRGKNTSWYDYWEIQFGSLPCEIYYHSILNTVFSVLATGQLQIFGEQAFLPFFLYLVLHRALNPAWMCGYSIWYRKKPRK